MDTGLIPRQAIADTVAGPGFRAECRGVHEPTGKTLARLHPVRPDDGSAPPGAPAAKTLSAA